LEKGNEDDGNAPIFHTGSGKSVLLRQSLIAKAISVQQFAWKPSIVEQFVWQDLSHSGMIAGVRNNGVIGDDLLVPRSLLVSKSGILKSQLVKEVDTDLLQPEAQYSAPKPPPFKFHTTGAGGRSFSVQGVFLVTQT
jgi:breast cancer 2 susceptibility protein